MSIYVKYTRIQTYNNVYNYKVLINTHINISIIIHCNTHIFVLKFTVRSNIYISDLYQSKSIFIELNHGKIGTLNHRKPLAIDGHRTESWEN